LARSVRPDLALSEEALNFLRSFDQSGASSLLELHVMQGRMLVPMDGDSGAFEFKDLRYFEDDIGTLINAGLLRSSYNSKGQRILTITRQASNLVSRLQVHPSN
jgi:hypothetical protein